MRRDEREVLPATDDADLATSDAYPPTLLRKPRLRIGRRIAATIAIIGIGIIGGAIAGTTVLLMMALVPARGGGVQVDFRELLFLPLIGLMYGGPAGAVLAPTLAWTLLRRVSLGRAFLTCLLGAVVGSVVGAVVGALVTSGDRMSNAFTGVLAGSVIGTIASAVLLRRRTRRPAPLERSN